MWARRVRARGRRARWRDGGAVRAARRTRCHAGCTLATAPGRHPMHPGCHRMHPGCHRMCPGCRPMCPGARCTTSSAVPARSGACSPPSWAASTKLGRGFPGRGCAPASQGWRSTRRRRRPRRRRRRAAAQAAPSPVGLGRRRRWSGGAPPEETRLQPYVPRLQSHASGLQPSVLGAGTPCVWTGLQPHASRRAVEEKLLRLEQIHAAALGELARWRAAATQGWDDPKPEPRALSPGPGPSPSLSTSPSLSLSLSARARIEPEPDPTVSRWDAAGREAARRQTATMDLVRERILEEPRRSCGSRGGDLDLARRRALELPRRVAAYASRLQPLHPGCNRVCTRLVSVCIQA